MSTTTLSSLEQITPLTEAELPPRSPRPKRAGANPFRLIDPRASEFAPFVSRLAVQSLTRSPRTTPAGRRLKAAALFADLSGFSCLAETMSAAGGDGPRRLAEVLNGAFGVLIDTVLRHGGDVTGFAGDGLTAVWPARDWRGLGDAATLAAQCGRAMQAALADPHAAQGATLPSMRVGVGAGELFSVHVGGVRRRWVHCILGPAVNQATRAQQASAPGDVNLSPAATRLVGRRARVTVLRGHARVDAVVDPVKPFRSPPVCVAGYVDQIADSYVPAAVRARVAAGRPRRPEVRRVSVLFVNLPHLDHGADLADAQGTMEAIQRAVADGRGVVDKLMLDGKGATLVAAFGMPPGHRAGGAVDAVRTAHVIRRALRHRGWTCSVGVTTGRAFCGEVGNRRRREYTILGATVNRAARLMQRADGGVLVDGTTARAVGCSFELDVAPAMELPGTGGRLPVFRVLGPEVAESENPRFVGRFAERGVLDAAVRRLARGQGGVVLVEGGVGVGKSRLLDYTARRHAASPTLRVLRAAGDPADRHAPYQAWRSIFRDLLGGPVLGPFPEVPGPLDRGAGLAADARRTAIAELLAAAAASRPLIILMDDVHELDAASWALVERVREQSAPVLLVLAGRAPAAASPEYRRLRSDPAVRLLEPAPLSSEEVRAIGCGVLHTRTLPDGVHRRLVRAAAGNPLATEQLMAAWVEEGRIERRGRRVFGRGSSRSTDLEGTLHRRFQRCEEPLRRLLQVASVIGLRFRRDTLTDLWDGDRPAPLGGRLARLVESGLVVRVPEARYTTHAFASEALRAVVEATIRPARSRALHRAAAKRLEGRPGGLEVRRSRIARHWSAAGEPALALPHLTVLFEQAHATGVPEAVVAVSELDALFAGSTDEGRSDAGRRLRILGEALLAVGRVDEGRDRLSRALTTLDEPLGSDSAVWIRARAAALAAFDALRPRDRSGSREPSEGARRRRLEAARARLASARDAAGAGDDLRAEWHAAEGLRLAPTSSAEADRAELHAELAAAAARRGDRDRAASHTAGARRMLAAGVDAHARFEVLLQLAEVARLGGRHHAWDLHLRRARALAREESAEAAGRRAKEAHARALTERGSSDQAARIFDELAETARRRGDRPARARAMRAAACALLVDGSPDEGFARLEVAARLPASAGPPSQPSRLS